MKTNDKVREENYNIIKTEKQQKYQHYHLQKIDKYEYLTGKEMLLSNRL